MTNRILTDYESSLLRSNLEECLDVVVPSERTAPFYRAFIECLKVIDLIEKLDGQESIQNEDLIVLSRNIYDIVDLVMEGSTEPYNQVDRKFFTQAINAIGSVIVFKIITNTEESD